MKPFRKTEQGLFICEECGQFYTFNGLSKHICFNHFDSTKIYYDKWLKEENDGICKICGKLTEWRQLGKGYQNICINGICDKKWNLQRSVEGSLAKYGVPNMHHLKEESKKSVEKTKKMLKEKYGNENYNNREKCKKTMLEHFGVDHNFKGILRDKIKETWIKKFGVENPNQNVKVSDKVFKKSLTLKKFKDTNICYQASYELDFLNKYYEQFKNEITRGPSIKYIFNNKNKVYHADFYVPSLNLVIECKNSYLAKRDKDQILEKKKSTISNGFNYIMIIDKDYTEFNKLYS